MKSKVVLAITIILVLIGILSTSSLASTTYQLTIVKKQADIQYLEEKRGYLENSITSIEETTGKVNMTMALHNKKNTQEEELTYENTEIFIMVPVSASQEKKNEYSTYVETLANKIFEANEKTKIGIIGLKGTIIDMSFDEEGNAIWGENHQGDVEGTVNDGEIVVNLTNQTSALTNGIKNMNPEETQYYINLQAAIRLAKNSYSENVNKILISLYDNVPSIAIGVENQVSYGGVTPYDTLEEAVVAKHEKIVNYTKSEILSLQEENIDFILLRPEDTSFDQDWYDKESGQLNYEFDGSPYVQELYGTLENPTYGKMYSLDNNSLETIVTEYIYQDVMEEVGTSLTSVIVKPYFSQKILENFDISFEENANIDISTLEEGYITWNVGNLENGKSSEIHYTLTMKNIEKSELLNQEIPITDKVEVSYVNYTDTQKNATITTSPLIQLIEKEEIEEPNANQNTNTPATDDTVAPGTIPQAGATMTIWLGVSLVLFTAIIGYMKLRKMKDIQ